MQYRPAFAALRQRLMSLDQTMSVHAPEHIVFAKEAQRITEEYCWVKAELQRLRTGNKVDLQLPPSYFDGAMPETEKYLRILSFMRKARRQHRCRLTGWRSVYMNNICCGRAAS